MKTLSGQVDQRCRRLIADLKDRGLLDSTLVVWMGEFGRTPNINTRGAKPGRDHYPRAWSLAMFGGGIKGGQVIGATDKEGATVVERKTSAQDFLATVCEVLGIDHTKKNDTPNGRPIRSSTSRTRSRKWWWDRLQRRTGHRSHRNHRFSKELVSF